MHGTLIRLGRGNISTHHGQIKILKNGSLGGSSGTNDLLSYIRRSTKAGTYRTQDEIQEMNQTLQDNPMDLRRVRWNMVRGSKIEDYPVEYQILSLNPPAPFQPKMPLKTLRKQYNEYQKNHRPTDRLARQYLHKLQQKEASAPAPNGQGSQAPVSADEYYRRLLGGSGAAGGAGTAGRKLSQAQKALQQKSSAVQKSYLVAMKQYQLMQQQQGEDEQTAMSEQDALAEVERLLATDEQKERTASRSRAETLHRQQSEAEEETEQQNTKKKTDESIMTERGQMAFPNADPRARRTIEKKEMDRSKKASSSFYGNSDNNASIDDSDDSSLSMLYGNDQRGFEGYVVWTKRLQAVPYNQWTVGASTALDHWIAKRVLGLSEETWLALLEGNSPQLLGRGRDIVMARQALFPETVLDSPSLDTLSSSITDDIDDTEMGGEFSSSSEEMEMNELLENLASWDNDSLDTNASSDHDIMNNNETSSSLSHGGGETDQLAEELQEWRRAHADSPYDSWSDERKQSLMVWIENFVSSVVTESSALATVDLDQTRVNLLSVPPQTKDEVDSFWENMRDETSAEILLQKLLDDRASSSSTSSDDDNPFWQLDYPSQLQRLVNLGTIGEVANEYVSEADRAKFLTRYGDYLCEGIELDYLVPDPTGPILASKDLGQTLIKAYNIEPDQRFRLQKMKHGQNGDKESMSTESSGRARDLYKAWNMLKVGRANYEEKMFSQGKLGLAYDNKDPRNEAER
mmetsp:Transcript_11448/g.27330  ORF Transcript_11448/g.27330 Transcript_11448/m.27330 type:complete len:745 (+) Transcript_11448:56-2290(+)